MMRKRRWINSLLIFVLALTLLVPFSVFADDGGEIVLDDYVFADEETNGEENSEEEMVPDEEIAETVEEDAEAGENAPEVETEAPEESTEENLAEAVEEAGLEVDSSAVTPESETNMFIYDAAEAEAENKDGDDTYVSNTGQVFTIPRVDISDGKRVYDFAGLFTEAEKEELEKGIAAVAAKKDADIAIVTSRDVPMDASYGMETTMKYVEQFYMDNGFKDDALFFIIDMGNRVLWTMGHGKYADEKYVKFHKEVYDDTMSKARNGDYYGAGMKFVDDTKKLDEIIYKLIPTPLSLILSSILSLLSMLFMTSKHNRTQPSKANTPRLRVNHYHTVRHDTRFLGTHTTRRTIHRDSGGSSGGGGGFTGGTHSGGGFSGGGGSFSGGGGHF